jgi:hypothetical protein
VYPVKWRGSSLTSDDIEFILFRNADRFQVTIYQDFQSTIRKQARLGALSVTSTAFGISTGVNISVTESIFSIFIIHRFHKASFVSIL